MKNTYIKPEMIMMDIDMSELICASGDSDSNSVVMSAESEDNTNALSRRRSLWDDDEEL